MDTDVRRNSRPRGKGWYLRADMMPPAGISAQSIALLKSIGVRFAAVHLASIFTMQKLESAGIYTWVFAGPKLWSPDKWRTTLAQSMARAAEVRSYRIWADPEGDGPGGDRDWAQASRAEWLEFGAALADAGRQGYQVGVTTHGGLRRPLESYIAPQLVKVDGFISPQLYDHMRDAPIDYAAKSMELWKRTMSGCEIVPSVGCFSTGPEGPVGYNAERFRQVIAGYDAIDCIGAIYWPVPRTVNGQWQSVRPNEYKPLRDWKVGVAPEI